MTRYLLEPDVEYDDDFVIPRLPPHPERAWVYFVAGAGVVKIGFATNVANRFRGLELSSPVPLLLLGTIERPYKEAVKLELDLHKRFASERRHGEWFQLESTTVVACLTERGGTILGATT